MGKQPFSHIPQISLEMLVSKASAGDADAMSQLIARYLPIIRRRVGGFRGMGLERDDLVQEGLIGFVKAVHSFDPHGAAHFNTYAMLCINTQIASAVKRALGQKHKPLKDYVSFSDIELTDDAQNSVLSSQSLLSDPQSYVISKEKVADIQQKMDTLLSDFERQALELYLSGHSYQEIASVLQTTTKAVDNALQRVRRKLKSL